MSISFVVRRAALLIVPILLLACSHVVYSPAPVVPTKQSLPYAATLTLAQVGVYHVKPGATMVADPAIANHVTGSIASAGPARTEWEQAILRYLESRKTFARVATTGPSDIELVLHANVYMDPGVSFQYRHIYVAQVDAAVRDPRTHVVLLSYKGHGKAFGDVRRDGVEDDQDPINHAVQMALNDLFGKLEQDGRMRRL